MLNCTIDLPILDRLCIEKPPRTQAGCADALNVPEDSSVDEVARFAPSGERLGGSAVRDVAYIRSAPGYPIGDAVRVLLFRTAVIQQ